MRNPLATALEKTCGPLPKPADTDVHVVALVKGAERYVLLFDAATEPEALRTIGRWASDPTLSFSWYDAAYLSQRISKKQ